MLVVKDLQIDVGNARILPDNLYLEKPNIVFYVGKTGSGKTVLLKTIAGIMKDIYHADVKGRIEVNGTVFYIPQEPWIITLGLKGIDELVFYGYLHRKIPLPDKHVEELVSKRINDMSYGEKRLLEIVKSLYINAETILIDEPFESLDSHNRALVGELLEYLISNGKTIVATSKKPLQKYTNLSVRKISVSRKQSLDPSLQYGSNRKGRIHLKNAYLRRGKKKIRLPDIELRPGDAAAITGPNGAGKTSLLLGIAGSLRIHGEYLVNGEIGIVPDDLGMIYPWKTVYDLVGELCKGRGECVNTVFNILDNLRIAYVDKFFYELSDGEKRLVILLSQLIRGVDILLVDGGLEYVDYERAKEIEKFFKEFLRLGGIIITTLPMGDVLDVQDGLHLFSY